MGMDIWSESGFVIPFERFLGLFQPPHLLGVKKQAIPLFRNKWLYCDSGEYCRSKAELDELLAQIENAESIDTVVASISAYFMGGPSFHVGDGVEDPEMDFITRISRVVLPIKPYALRSFDAGVRVNGSDVPQGTPVLIFKYEDCFETHMTTGGQALACALGESSIEPCEWTIRSI